MVKTFDNAAAKDEFAWMDDFSGGWFTGVLCEKLGEVDDWSRAFNLLHDSANAVFQFEKQNLLKPRSSVVENNFSFPQQRRLRISGLQEYRLKKQKSMTATAFTMEVDYDKYAGE